MPRQRGTREIGEIGAEAILRHIKVTPTLEIAGTIRRTVRDVSNDSQYFDLVCDLVETYEKENGQKVEIFHEVKTEQWPIGIGNEWRQGSESFVRSVSEAIRDTDYNLGTGNVAIELTQPNSRNRPDGWYTVLKRLKDSGEQQIRFIWFYFIADDSSLTELDNGLWCNNLYLRILDNELIETYERNHQRYGLNRIGNCKKMPITDIWKKPDNMEWRNFLNFDSIDIFSGLLRGEGRFEFIADNGRVTFGRIEPNENGEITGLVNEETSENLFNSVFGYMRNQRILHNKIKTNSNTGTNAILFVDTSRHPEVRRTGIWDE